MAAPMLPEWAGGVWIVDVPADDGREKLRKALRPHPLPIGKERVPPKWHRPGHEAPVTKFPEQPYVGAPDSPETVMTCPECGVPVGFLHLTWCSKVNAPWTEL